MSLLNWQAWSMKATTKKWDDEDTLWYFVEYENQAGWEESSKWQGRLH